MSLIVVQDIAALKEHLNSEVAVTDYIEVTQDRINRFAAVTEDWQWIHTDTERASRESPLGKTVVHGFLILSFLSYFVNSAVQIQGIQQIVSCGLNSVRFLGSAPAGGRIRGRVALKEYADGPGFTTVIWHVTVECEGIRFPACTANWMVRYYSQTVSETVHS